MKKTDLKNTYDNISISEQEKLKIYNNIINEKNKKTNFNPFVFLTPAFLLVVVLLCILVNYKINPNEIKDNTLLSNDYKKEIVISLNSYLNSNEINLAYLDEGEELEIDSSKIVTSDEYKMCSGKVIIKRYKDGYTYTPEVNCENSNSDKETIYYIYDGRIDNIHVVENDYLIESHTNIDNENNFEYYDDNILLFNESGELQFEYTIEREMFNSIVFIDNVFKINDNYLLLVTYGNDVSFYENESGDLLSSYTFTNKFILLDKYGKEINDLKINNLNEELLVYKYVYQNRDNDKIYLSLPLENDNLVYYEINLNNLETKKINSFLVDIETANYIGIYNNFQFVEDQNKLLIYNIEDKKLVNTISLDEDYYIRDMYRKNDKYYIFAFSRVQDGDNTLTNEYVFTYDDNFNKINTIKLDDYDYIYYNRINLNDNLYVSTTNFLNSENNIYELNLNGEKINKIFVEPLDDNFQNLWGYYDYFTKTKNGVNMIYSLNGLNFKDNEELSSTENQILFVTIR